MAEYESSEEVITACEDEITNLLQADLNLRTADWTNSSSDLLTEETNAAQEEVCESVIEEIVTEPENDNYLTCVDDDCMEESIVYVFDEPVVEFELSDSHYIIQEPEAYEFVEPEVSEPGTMNSDSSLDADKNGTTFMGENTVCEEKVEEEESTVHEDNVRSTLSEENTFSEYHVQETSKVCDESVNKFSENELIVNKCTVDLPLSSDNSLKTCNLNENSDSVDSNLNECNNTNIKTSELSESVEVETDLGAQDQSYGGDDSDTNVIFGPLPENVPYPADSEVDPKFEISDVGERTSEMSPKHTTTQDTSNVVTPPNLLSSILNKNKQTPLRKAVMSSELNSLVETKSPQSDCSTSPGLKTLGKDQIKKRLQSFSLMKQGIQPLPIKKIINPKQPKVHTQIEEVYDETGRKTDEKLIVKKPPKQGPTPSEKARQVIDEIEQIKREEAAIYEQTLMFMKHSMRDAHRKKSKSRRERDRTRSPVRRDKRIDKDSTKRTRKISEDHKHRRSVESDKHRKSPEKTKPEKKKNDRSVEKEQPKNVMPQSWREVKRKNIEFEKIKKMKEQIFKFIETPKDSPTENNKRDKKNKKVQPEERNTVIKKEDFPEPQLMFEFPSMLRSSLVALSVAGGSKYYPPETIRFTEKLPSIAYCEDPKKSSALYRSRKQVLSEIPEERAEIMLKIIENKIGPTIPGTFKEGTWYPANNYLEESKNEETVTSYGLSVLSEMYNDEQEETLNIEPEKSDKKSKKHKEKKKSKKKHKKRKTKSRSRSSSAEKSQEHEQKKEKKSKSSKKHKEKDNDNDINKEEITHESEAKPMDEPTLNKSPLKEEIKKEERKEKDDNTPNTDEYRSNWESDEDFLNEIIPTNNSNQYRKSSRKTWEIDEGNHIKYDERKQMQDSTKIRGRSSSDRLTEEHSKRWPEEDRRKHETKRSTDIRPDSEDRRSSLSFRNSEERVSPRQSFGKNDSKRHTENRRESEDFEHYRSSTNRTEHSLGYEEMMYESRYSSTNLRRSEERCSSRHGTEKSDLRKSIDHRLEETYEFESKRSSSSLRKFDEKEVSRRHSETDFRKSIDFRQKSVDMFEDIQRKVSESDLERKISESSDHQNDRKSRYSVEKEVSRRHSEIDLRKSQDFRQKSFDMFDDIQRKVSESDLERKISESSDHKNDRKSRYSVEKDRKLNQLKDERSRHDSDSKVSQEELKRSRFDSEEKNNQSEHDNKKILDRARRSVEKDIQLKRRDSFEKLHDRKQDSEETKYASKHNTTEKVKEEAHYSKDKIKSEEKSRRSLDKIRESSREKKSVSSDRDKRRDSKPERSLTPDRKKAKESKHEEKKLHHKWSSDEDIHKSSIKHDNKRKSEDKHQKNIEESIKLNLNKYQRSQWSSDDEEFDRRKTLSDDKRSRNYDDDLHFIDKEKLHKPRVKSRWDNNNSDNESENYRSEYDSLLNEDLVNLKDLERQRKLTEEIKVRDDDSSRKSSKKAKSVREKSEERDKHKKSKKKSKDKKMKFKKEKKPKVKITYSDTEDSFDEDFQTAEQKQQGQHVLIVQNTESAKKYAAKIKIDYSDFDLSLSESKDKYDKKIVESRQGSPEIPKQVESTHVPKERKVNIDLSEIILDHQVFTEKNVEIESTTPKQKPSLSKDIQSGSIKTPDLPKTPEHSKIIPESSKRLTETAELLSINLKTPDLSKSISKMQEPSELTPKISDIIKSSTGTPEKSVDFYKLQEMVTPNTNKLPEKLIELKTPKTNEKSEIVGITPIVPKISSDIPSPAMTTPNVTPIKILPEISPVAPPVLPILKPVIDIPVTPIQDPSKLVSEYEEFMKAVSFDELKEEADEDISPIVKEKSVTQIEEKQKTVTQEKMPVEIIEEKKTIEEENGSSTYESSSEYESSEEEPSDSSSESDASSESSETRRNKMLETVANIKTEKVTDSENESQEARPDKRKRNESDSSSESESFDNVVVKVEKDIKKLKKSEDVISFECESKYNNVIDWEKTYVDNTHLYPNYEELTKLPKLTKPVIDVSDIMPQNILPENIPLPAETIVKTIPVQDIPIPDYSLLIQSPTTDVISISSDSSTPSPTKKLRSLIPIKLLTAESRKQANETALSFSSDTSSGFGKIAPPDLLTHKEEKAISVGSSSDVSQTSTEILPTSINETAESQEQIASRKRQSQWNMNIAPAKKPLLQTNPLAEPDSDEDFTDKFIKHSDKKQEQTKLVEETKDKDKSIENTEMTAKDSISKSELSVREDKKDDKKSSEPRKLKEDDDKFRQSHDKPRDKSRHSPDRRKDDRDKDRRSSTPKSEKDKRTPRRSSREKTDRHDKNERNDRKDKTRDSLEKKRDRSRERSRDRSMRELVRDRDKRRQSDRRLSDRKLPPRVRSPRSRYSRDRELARARPQDRTRDRPGKLREPEREGDRPRERIREIDRNRDNRERDDRRNYRRDDRRLSRSLSPHRKDYREAENIHISNRRLERLEDTDFSTTNMDIVQSPINSPLDGFKRSLADSTISDSELVAQLNTPDESNEPSPAYSQHPQQYYRHIQDVPPANHQSPSSPKRISLDDRINLVLGIEKEPPKSIDTVCSRGPYANNSTAPNYDPYGYGRSEYDVYNAQSHQPDGYIPPPYQTPYQAPYYPNPINTDNNVKVLQVGNVIQVVPTEQPAVLPSTPVPKPIESTPKVVQVGNMLQIVPVTIMETTTTVVSSPVIAIPPTIVTEKAVVPKATDQLAAERRAEKEKRRQEREARRKEKEKKRKEKEKRRQLKIKTKTENMIKRALMLETGEGELDVSTIEAEPVPEPIDNNNLPMSWPPASALTPVPLPRPPGKGILISHGFRNKDEPMLDDSMETRKVVKFADGICPGEGTSPSGGEELPSPPPPPRKLPKEKRYKRIKKNNKKKIKVKIIRTQQQAAEDESSEEDNLPPPPPPPGSPPPHLWPPRIKQPPVNNIHPSLPANVFPHAPPAYPAPQQVMYPPAYPPIAPAGQPVPVVMGHAPPPPPTQRQHNPPVMPVLQTGPSPLSHHGAHQSSFHH